MILNLSFNLDNEFSYLRQIFRLRRQCRVAGKIRSDTVFLISLSFQYKQNSLVHNYPTTLHFP